MAYLRGGSGGSTPPPDKIFRFFLKSEGKEVEGNTKGKGCVAGGGVTC